MSRPIVVVICSVAALALAVVPSMSVAEGCGDGSCEASTYGQGGEASGGSAQGGYDLHPTIFHPGSFSNAGNSSAGRVNITSEGTLSGTNTGGSFKGEATCFRGDPEPVVPQKREANP